MLSASDRQALLDQFRAGEACPDCKGLHTMACPRIKRKAFHPNGNLIEVEYWPFSEYKDAVVWPEDVFEEEDTDGTAP